MQNAFILFGSDLFGIAYLNTTSLQRSKPTSPH